MGATPAWFTLALTIPEANQEWLSEFADGLFNLANQFNLQLVGGDTTRGPLTITIQAHGFVPEEKVLHRAGAKPGDKIYVSGNLGDAGFGLMVAMGKVDLTETDRHYVLNRLNRPEPRLQLGLLLREFASTAIDISDGLLADLQHILTASEVGAELHTDKLPISRVLRENLSALEAHKLALTAGDDYELCFTVAENLEQDLLADLAKQNIICTCVGTITEALALTLDGSAFAGEYTGYLHFKPNDSISAKH
jgi:thiamine-monophosphate kinase